MTRDCNLLGKFELTGIPPAPRGVPQIEATFDIDANGILNVSAMDRSTNKEKKITITNDKGRLSKDRSERMLLEAEQYKNKDENNKLIIESKNAAENYAHSRQHPPCENLDSKFDPEDKKKLENKVDETIKWLDNNQMAEKDEYEHKRTSSKSRCLSCKRCTSLHKVPTPWEHKAMPDFGGMGAQGPSFGSSSFSGPKVEEVDEKELD